MPAPFLLPRLTPFDIQISLADPAPPTTKRYAGKRFTVGFLALVVTMLVASVLVNRRFEAITARIEVLRQEWGGVAEVLETRFAKIDAATQHDRSAAAKEYRRLRAAYRKSSLYDEQSRLLTGLWESYRAWRAKAASPDSPLPGTVAARDAPPRTPVSVEDRATVERFIAADKEAGKLLREPLGRLTQSILLLDYPPQVYPTLEDIAGWGYAVDFVDHGL